MTKLLPFQKKFLEAVENPQYDTVAISGPRSLGKTFIAAQVLIRCMTPGDALHQPGKEYILGAATLEQARLTYNFIRAELEPTGKYRWIDSTTRLGATHLKTNTKLRAISSNAKSSFGLVNVPLVVLDEPGALEIVGGQMLSDSLFTAQGKVGSRLKLILAGTFAPMATSAGHWWWDLLKDGTRGRTHVQLFQGDAETWDKWATIRKANPLIGLDAHTRKVILEERDAARGDSRLKARFLSYRLNVPSGDESTMLLTVDDWKMVTARETPPRDGRPIVAVDLGAGRAWSAAVAIYRNGRTEAIALAPGIPDIAGQEKRDRVPVGTYQKLVSAGLLHIADGLRVQPPAMLAGLITETWGTPAGLISDRFRIPDMADAGLPVEPRMTRWSESSEDIRALRKMAKDGPLSVDPGSAPLLEASLAVASVKNDSSGNTRLEKRGSNNTSRDDVAAALTLGAGAHQRRDKAPRKGGVYRGKA